MSALNPPGWSSPGPDRPRVADPAADSGYQLIPGYSPPPPPGPPPEPQRPSRSGTGTTALAIVAIGLSLLALLVSIAAIVMVGPAVAGIAGLNDDPGGYGAYSLPGRLAGRAAGVGVSSAELQDSLIRVLENDDWDVGSIACPATARVAQGVVTPCHAELDEDDYAVIVFFDDGSGHYTALIS